MVLIQQERDRGEKSAGSPTHSVHSFIRRQSGQTTTEYVGVVAVVVALIALTAAIPVDGKPIAAHIVKKIRHGLCIVTGGVCTAADARRAGFEPCSVSSISTEKSKGVKILVVDLDDGEKMLIENRSDGSVVVSFTDKFKGGATVGLGVKTSLLKGQVDASATASAGVSFEEGKSYEFANTAAAQHFVATHVVANKLKGDKSLPQPATKYIAGGVYGELAGNLGVGKSAEAELSGKIGAVLGRRVRGKETTWYFKTPHSGAAKLSGAIGSIGANGSHEGTIELTERDNKWVNFKLKRVQEGSAGAELSGKTTRVSEISNKLQSVSGQIGGDRGWSTETTQSLDLTKPENEMMVKRYLIGLAHSKVSGTATHGVGLTIESTAALDRHIAAHGDIDIRSTQYTKKASGFDAEGSFGIKLGYHSTKEVLNTKLIGAWSLRGNGQLREREDCLEKY